ncbi:MAG: hypothetical protein AB2552_23215, partial [Candidatus Thiodiazotropha endolucinida]
HRESISHTLLQNVKAKFNSVVCYCFAVIPNTTAASATDFPITSQRPHFIGCRVKSDLTQYRIQVVMVKGDEIFDLTGRW